MNVELLLRVKAKILAHPEQLAMDQWVLSCGTAACIAGEVCLQSGAKAVSSTEAHLPGEPVKLIPTLARELLGIDDDDGRDLFHVDGWRRKWRNMYDGPDSCEEYPRPHEQDIQLKAKAAAGAIDDFIAKHTKPPKAGS